VKSEYLATDARSSSPSEMIITTTNLPFVPLHSHPSWAGSGYHLVYIYIYLSSTFSHTGSLLVSQRASTEEWENRLAVPIQPKSIFPSGNGERTSSVPGLVVIGLTCEPAPRFPGWSM